MQMSPNDYEGKFVKTKLTFDSFITLQGINLHRTEKDEIIFITKITRASYTHIKFEFVNLEMKTFYNGATPGFFDNAFEVII